MRDMQLFGYSGPKGLTQLEITKVCHRNLKNVGVAQG